MNPTISELLSTGRYLYLAFGEEAVSLALAELGADAPLPLLKTCVRLRARDARRAAQRREYHEQSASFLRREAVTEPTCTDYGPADYLDSLSGRTREIVSRVIEGETQSSVASALGISQPTVQREFHAGIAAIRAKFGIGE